MKPRRYNSGKAFAMATPDYLQQVIISGQRRESNGRRTYSTRFGLFRRPSVHSMVWATLDLITVIIAGALALRLRFVLPVEVPTLSAVPHLLHSSHRMLFFYIGWYAVCLIFFTRSYGLY